MASHFEAFHAFLQPDPDGGVLPSTTEEAIGSSTWDAPGWNFTNSGAADVLYGLARIPLNYDGNPKFVALVLSPTNTGNFIMEVTYRIYDDGEDADQSVQRTLTTSATAIPSTADEALKVEFSDANLTSDMASNAGKWIKFTVGRRSGDAGDTLADLLFMEWFGLEYTDAL